MMVKRKKILKRKDEKEGRCLQLGERLLPFLSLLLPYFLLLLVGKISGICSLEVLRIRLLDSVI